jgi:hypothetical protein
MLRARNRSADAGVVVHGVAALCCVVGLVSVGAACTADDDTAGGPARGPAGDTRVLPPAGDPDTVNADFEGVPLYPGSEPIGVRSEKDGVVTRSFRSPSAQPNEVMSHFVNTLGEPAGGVDDIGDGLRGEFRTEDARPLTISVTRLGGNPGDTSPGVQYSLVVHPRGPS